MYYNDYYGFEEMIGAFIAIFVFILLFFLICAILTLIGQAKTFKKGNEEGWKVLIPFYSQYTLCKMVGVNPYWILIVFVLGLLATVPFVGLLSSIATIYFMIILNVSVAKSFGKDGLFAAGLIFIAPVFWLILGYGKSEFMGPTPMNDPIMNFLTEKMNSNNNVNMNNNMNNNVNMNNNMNNNVNMNNNSNINNNNNQYTNSTPQQSVSSPQKSFCPNCGVTLENDSIYCTSCGTKIN